MTFSWTVSVTLLSSFSTHFEYTKHSSLLGTTVFLSVWLSEKYIHRLFPHFLLTWQAIVEDDALIIWKSSCLQQFHSAFKLARFNVVPEKVNNYFLLCLLVSNCYCQYFSFVLSFQFLKEIKSSSNTYFQSFHWQN